AVPWCDALLLRILGRRRLHQRPHQRLVRRDPVGDRLPLLPVPLLEFHAPAPLRIVSSRYHGRCGASSFAILAARGTCFNPAIYRTLLKAASSVSLSCHVAGLWDASASNASRSTSSARFMSLNSPR